MSAYAWLVIGGGIPALVSALALQQRGEQVLVIDDNTPSASRAGAGILSPLPPWRYPPAITALADAGAAAYPQLLAGLDESCAYEQNGLLVLPPHDTTALARWQQSGGKATLLYSDEICPQLARQQAVYLPQVATIEPRRLIKALRRCLPRQVGKVTRLETRGSRVVQVCLSNGDTLTADNIVLSAGAWTAALCPSPAPAIKPIRGDMLLYDAPAVQLPTVLLQEAHGFYLRQRPDGKLLAGSSSEDSGFDSTPGSAAVAQLKQRAAAVLPALAGVAPRQQWAGLRPAAALPVIARHTQLDNLYINSGHFRYGVTMAPAAAAHLLQVIDEKIAPADNAYGMDAA